MVKMTSKPITRATEIFRYEPEDLEAPDRSKDEAVIDGFVERNKYALNASLEKARAEFERGEYLTLDQVRANLSAQRRHLRASSSKKV
jgi:hypothetical protein